MSSDHGDGAGSAPFGTAQPRRSRFPTDYLVAGAILAFCAAAYGVTLTFDRAPSSVAQGMQPAAFPQLVLLVLAGLAVLLAWSARGRKEARPDPVPAMVYLTALAILGVMGVIYLAGLPVATVVAVVGIGRLWGERRWPRLILVAICLAVTVRVLFVNVFGVGLPTGMFPNLLQ